MYEALMEEMFGLTPETLMNSNRGERERWAIRAAVWEEERRRVGPPVAPFYTSLRDRAPGRA